jgi:CRISPR/Cas system endoribonuclease Cas6 (RAMP superfamily)
MRFKITLNIDKRECGDKLPFNYQYECSAVIYKILSKSDSKFSDRIWIAFPVIRYGIQYTVFSSDNNGF